MEQVNKEALEFEVDRNIINHVIASQSSSVNDAIAELVQNSMDAGATKCHIWLDEYSFKVCDNGKGFASKEEVQEYFGKFGTPHESDDHTRFGRFRMGRGQIMNLAATVWRSSQFEMQVDIKQNGLTYEFSEGLDQVSGCEITGTWNEPIDGTRYSSVESNISYIKHKLKYLFTMQVYLNDELISLSPTAEWDLETDTFYYKRIERDLRLSIYNLGVMVSSFDPLAFRDLKGVVITKKHLSLNTSRDQVLEGCEVWKEIATELREFKPIHIKKGNLTHDEMGSFISHVFEGLIPWSAFFDVKCFLNHNNSKRFTFDQLVNECKGWCFPPDEKDDRSEIIADKLWQQHRYVVLSYVPFYFLKGQINEFFESLQEYIEGDIHTDDYITTNRLAFLGKYHSYWNLRGFVASQDSSLLEDDALTAKELIAIKAFRSTVNYCYNNISKWATNHTREAMKRNIFVGEDERKLGWTDGCSFIALERGLLKEMNWGVMGCEKIVSVYFHELCHEKDYADVHSEEFYARFHDLVCYDGRMPGGSRFSPLAHFALHLNKNHYLHLIASKKKVTAHIASSLPPKQRDSWLAMKKHKMALPNGNETVRFRDYGYHFIGEHNEYTTNFLVYVTRYHNTKKQPFDQLSDEELIEFLKNQKVLKSIEDRLKVKSLDDLRIRSKGGRDLIIHFWLNEGSLWL